MVPRFALILITYLAIYIALDWLTNAFEILPRAVAWYPADGLSLALLLSLGARSTPALAIASLISAFIIRQIQLPAYALIGWSIVFPLIFGATSLFLRHRVQFDPQLRSMRDVLWLILSSSVISAILAIGSVSAETTGGISPVTEQIDATFHWWTGELIGMLVLTPLLLIYVMPIVKRFAVGDLVLSGKKISIRRPSIKFIGQVISIPLALYIVFGIQGLQTLNLLYLLALPLLWIALDGGLSGISIGIPMTSFGIAFVLGRQHIDPAILDDLQLFMLVMYISTLLVGVARTERIRVGKALEGSEKRFRALIENNADAITLLDADGKTLYDSPAAPGMLGYAPDELIGSNAFDLIHKDDLHQTLELFKKLVQSSGNRDATIIRLKRKDGSLIWIELIATNLLNEPSVGAVVLNYRDITSRKQVENAVRESEERYRLLVNTLPDGIIVHHQGHIVFANSASVSIMGALSQSDITNTPVIDFVHPDYRELALKRIQRSLSEGVPVPLEEEKFVRLDGTVIDVEVSAIPITYGGNPAMLTVFNEITERKRAEARLFEERNLLRILIDNLPDRIFVKDTQGRKTLANVTDVRVSGGKTMEDVIGKTDFDSYPRELAEEYWALDKATLDSGMPLLNHEERGLDAEGKPVSILTTKVPLRDGQGKIIGLVGIGRDITERKLAEKTLQESEEKYRLLFENNPLPMWVYDLETLAFLSVNDAAVSRYGYQRTEFLSMTIKDIRPAEELTALRENLAAAPKKVEVSGPWKHRKKEGSLIDVEIHSHEILFDGRPARLVLANDITERIQAGEVLANERNLLRTLIDHLPDNIFVKDINNRILIDNSAHRRLLRAATPEEVLGKTDYDFFPKEIAESYYNDEKQIFLTGNPLINREEPSIDIDGNKVWLQTTKVPIRDNKGIITGLVGINHNITENKKREERIRQQVAHLRALSDIDRAITASFGIEISLGTVLTHVTEQLNVDAAAILLYNQATNTLKFTSGRGFRTKAFEKAKVLSIGEGYAGQAILERRTLHISNLSHQTDNVRLQKAIPGEGFVSYYCVPLIAKGNIKGALEIFHRSQLEPDEEWLDFLQTLAGQAALAIDNATLFDGMQRSNVELTLAYDATIEGWSRALDLRDKETEGHTKRVTEITLRLAQLFGMNDRELVQIRRGALLHDIGKLGVPDGILLKPGSLSDEEWIVMRKHPQFAFDMLAPIQYLKPALDIPYCHHEKWDGTGYPRGLKGEQIPLTARVFAIVDVWDALTSDRPYRAAWTEEKVLAHIRSLAGTHFDPQVVKVCLESGLLNSHN